MHTEPRGQGSLPWHLRLNDLLGRANNYACTALATAPLPPSCAAYTALASRGSTSVSGAATN